MTLLAPFFALAALLAVPVVVVLWLLHSRFRSERVSSLLLWLDVPAPVAATRAWRLPRFDVLLVLQIAAVAALGLALGRPAVATAAARHVALVLDASVSMQAQDVAPTRFAVARQSLLNVIGGAGATDRFSVILATAHPAALVRDATAEEARQALEGARAEDAAGDLATAVRVAAVPRVTEVVVATDGATQLDLAPQGVPLTFRLVGGQADQIALSDVAVRQPIAGGQVLAGFATLANYTAAERSTRVEIVADSVLVDSEAVTLAPGTRSDVTFSVPVDTRSLRVVLPDADAVASDKQIDLKGPSSFARRLLVVSDHPDVWQRAAAATSWLAATSVAPADYAAPADRQIVLFDRWLPTELPETERILVDPPGSSGILVRDASGPRTEVVVAEDNADPLIRGVDLSGLTFTANGRATAPPWASLTLGSPDDFALGHGLLNGRRTIVFGFDPTASNLPQLAAFPVLLANAIDWLTPGRGDLLHAGLGSAVDITPHSVASPQSRGPVSIPPNWSDVWPYFATVAVLAIAFEALLAYRRGAATRVALGLSVAAAILATVALTQPGVWLADRAMTVVLAIDRSASVRQQSVDTWRSDAQRLKATVDRVGMVIFGRDTEVIRVPATGDLPGSIPSVADDGSTDIGQALRTAAALARDHNPARIVLLSDGHSTTGDVAAAEASLDGIPVDVVPLDASPPSPRVVLESLDVPQYVRAGDSIAATLTIGSTDATTVTLQALVDGQPVKNQPVALTQGHNRLAIDVSLEVPGFHRLTVSDGVQSVEGFVVVKPAERVMLVEERSGESAGVLAALRSIPGAYDVVPPSAISNLAQLEPYDAVVLANVSATSFTLDQQRTLQSFVQDRGRGLVALGGSTSFVLGDYEGSVLEQTLPVLSTIPPRREGARLALMLVIDISQSMDRTVDGVSGIEMAKQAAILSERSLRDDDQVGVVIFNHRFSWLQPIGVVSAIGRSNLEDRIAQLSASGGTEIFAALNEGATAMRGVTADLRQIVLFTDGNSRDANYDALTADLRQQHIGLSTVGLGPEADTKLLARLARDGQGRFYYSDRPSELPRILANEVAIAKRTSVVEGSITPQLVTPSPILRDIAPDQLPSLSGYIATTPRPTAEVVLATDDQKPLLAQWRSGLGRAVTWTSDVGGPWTRAWPDWAGNARLWQQAVAWAAGQPVQPDFLLSVSSSGDSAYVMLDDVRNDRFVDLASPIATIVGPGGEQNSVPLRQSGPGRYEASVVVSSPGTYAVVVTEGQRTETSGFVVRPQPEQSSFGADQQTLRRISSDTGGRVLATTADAFGDQSRAPGQHWQALWQLLLGIALAVFMVGLVARRFTGLGAAVAGRVRRQSVLRRARR